MKCIFLSFLIFFMVSACVYEAPLTEKHKIKIDENVLGLWVSEDNSEKMMVLKFSETEYLIHYPVQKDDFYFRAYPIKIGEHSMIQLQLIGNHEGTLPKNEKNLYTLAIYTMKDNQLEIRTINAKFLDNKNPSNGDFKNAEELKKAILKSKSIESFFEEPGRFKKVNTKP